jgi:hypothetical protein
MNAPTSPPPEPRPSEALRRTTGRDRAEWFAVLDAWGAADREYRDIAAWLTDEHDLSSWWAQKLIVEYEEARGLRAPGIRPGGTFAVGASKTVGVPVDRLVEAFIDSELRERWLPGASLSLRTSRPGRSARFDWEADGTRLNVDFAPKGESRSQVAVEHDHLPSAAVAEETKTFWRDRLNALKELLEGLRRAT